MFQSEKMYVLLLITAETCGACMKFKKEHRSNLLSSLSSIPDVFPVEISVAKMSGAELAKYHPRLMKLVSWFPTFLLTTKNQWEDKTSNLSCQILGGEYNSSTDNFKLIASQMRMDAPGILAWINSAKNRLNSSGVKIQPKEKKESNFRFETDSDSE
jgi:hypothetical protein